MLPVGHNERFQWNLRIHMLHVTLAIVIWYQLKPKDQDSLESHKVISFKLRSGAQTHTTTSTRWIGNKNELISICDHKELIYSDPNFRAYLRCFPSSAPATICISNLDLTFTPAKIKAACDKHHHQESVLNPWIIARTTDNIFGPEQWRETKVLLVPQGTLSQVEGAKVPEISPYMSKVSKQLTDTFYSCCSSAFLDRKLDSTLW